MFFDKEDDDHDFLSPGGSKLGALFGMDKAGNQGGNESLTYTAPKQPKKKESTPPGKGAPSVAFAVPVHAYKYLDNKYASQGKMGVAILANHATNEYSILMYVTQQQKVTTAKISSSFVFTCQANNYANFYDDARQSWSILFDNEQNATDFAKHICITKALSTGSPPANLTTQDLTAGEGGSLESGDSVEVKYTGWLMTNNTLGQVFDSNASADKLFRFKIGAGKVIKGWETGVIGMKKNSKRVLVIPPGLAYGSQGMGNRVPANSTLIFEVEVVRVKLVGRDSSPSPAQPPPQPVSTNQNNQADDVEEDEDQTVKGRTKSISEQLSHPVSTNQNNQADDMEEEEDQTVKGRTKSISEQLSHSPTQDTSKAKLISRMAKMGKPMLPFTGAVAAGESDEEPVPESPQPLTSRPNQNTEIHRPVPVSVSQPVQQQQQMPAQPLQQQQQPPVTVITSQQQPAFLQNLPGAQQMALYQPQQNFMQQQQQPVQQNMYQPGFQSQMYGAGNQPQPGTSLPPYIVPGLSQGQDMMLLSETRQQNTEVRLSLSKVSDKVDQVLQKLDHAQSQTSATSMLPNMETSVLLHNITRIVQENERLKKDVFEKSGKIETQNEKISELLQRNQSYVEKSQVLMEQRNEGLLSSANQSQNKVLALEQEKVQLTKDLTDATSQISTLQLEVASLKKKEFELSQQMSTTDKETRKQTEELETLKSQHEEDEMKLKELQRLLKEEKQSRKSIENSITQIQEEMTDLQTAKQLVEKNLLDRKKKSAEERRQMEDEMEDVKANLEAEIQSLKEKLRKQKTSASAASQEQISQIEEEINSDWQKKSDKLLAAAAEKHSRALEAVKEEKEELETQVKDLEKKKKSDKLLAAAAEKHSRALETVKEEKEELETQVKDLEKRIQDLKANSSGSDQRLSELQDQVEELSAWKDKYDSLRTNSLTMKERYESRIQEIEEERDSLEEKYDSLRANSLTMKERYESRIQEIEEERDSLEEKVSSLESEVEKLKTSPSVAAGSAAQPSGKLLDEVKKIMNTVYREMRETFDSEQSYSGTEILAAILGSIKSTTLSLMNKSSEQTPAKDDQDDEESEEEESEEEPSGDDDEEQEEQEEQEEKEEEKEEEQNVETSQVKENVEEEAKEESETVVEKEKEDKESNVPKVEEKIEINAVQQTSAQPSEETVIVSEDSKLESEPPGETVDESSEQNVEVEDVSISQAPADVNEEKEEEEDIKPEPVPDKPVRKADSLDNLLDEALESKPVTKPTPIVSTEPPPLFDESEEEEEDVEKDRTKSLFADDGDDDIVADTLGLNKGGLVNGKLDKPDKKADKLLNDEDLKPAPPPPLFGDDDDDDDLDWLS